MREIEPEVIVSRPRALWLYLALVLGLAQGLALVLFGLKGVIVALGAAYVYAVFRWPHLALVGALVFIIDGLGFINADLFRIPGVFKLKDLIFLSLLLPLLWSTRWQRRAKRIFHDCRILLFPVLVILGLTMLQMVRTSLQYDLPLNSCVMAGRHYWYYAFVPLAAIYLDTSHKRDSAFRLLMVVITGLACVVIIQTIIYAVFQTRIVSDDVLFQEAHWGNVQWFSRIYLAGEPLVVLGFGLAFWGLLLRPSGRGILGYAALGSLCILALLFINSRGRWVHAVLVILIPMLVLGPQIRRARGRLRYGLLVFVLAMTSLLVLAFHTNALLSGIGERAVSTWTDIRDQKGTWGGRLEDSQFRFKLFREHPLFGLGLVHPDYASRFGGGQVIELPGGLYFKESVTTTDSGIVTLLVNFGVVGLMWVAWYFFSAWRFCAKTMMSAKTGIFHWVPVPLIGYIAGGVLTFVTLGFFTMPGDIVGHSFLLGILAAGAHMHPGVDTKQGYA